MWASMRRFGPRQRHDHHMESIQGKRAGVVDDRAVDEDLLRRLRRFEVEYGRVPVARRYKCDDGFPLGLRLRTFLAQGPECHQMLRRALGGDLWPIRTSVKFRNEALAHLWAYVRAPLGVGADVVCLRGRFQARDVGSSSSPTPWGGY
jgi:hypothetical protein